MAADDTGKAPRMRGDIAYDRAMNASADLIHRIREAERETSAAREIMSDVWSQSKNVPFLTTVYQAVQEAKSGPETARDQRLVAFKINGHGGRRYGRIEP
jgi:hypothetical protein